MIGYAAGTSAAPSGNITIQSNIICIGDNDITNAYIKVPWTVTSDARDKTNISSILHGLEFVNSIEPIKYKNRVNRESNESSGPYRYGFKAQDILKLEGETPVIVDNTDPEYLKLKETSLIPILVNAIKELSAEVDKLKIKLLEKTWSKLCNWYFTLLLVKLVVGGKWSQRGAIKYHVANKYNK